MREEYRDLCSFALHWMRYWNTAVLSENLRSLSKACLLYNDEIVGLAPKTHPNVGTKKLGRSSDVDSLNETRTKARDGQQRRAESELRRIFILPLLTELPNIDTERSFTGLLQKNLFGRFSLLARQQTPEIFGPFLGVQ